MANNLPSTYLERFLRRNKSPLIFFFIPEQIFIWHILKRVKKIELCFKQTLSDYRNSKSIKNLKTLFP